MSKVVCSTVASTEEHEQLTLWSELVAHNLFLVGHWRTKAAIQRLVQEAGFESWAILQLSWIMKNWATPAKSYYWRVENGEKMIPSAFTQDTVLDLTFP